jgi:uncharacterized protein YyaL (SSP411 family)
MNSGIKPNHLIHEKSPYLLQHAHNPVDWYPWSEEALALAKKLDKPIFLSIGYSTCHWCHVMAHESFEDPTTAALLNKHFINIKVDREERPDLDAIYMTAVQALTQSGGWPMSVWLTPDLKPFYGGTYFPPTDRHGRPGFQTVITQLGDMYAQDREKISAASHDLISALKELTHTRSAASTGRPSAVEVFKSTFAMLKASYDKMDGGFGPAPKFPMPVYLSFLLRYYRNTRDPMALEMVRTTMERISKGGITDQLGGGFSRYSTDATWVVPHFEKMLYDNAQLISVSAALFEITGEPAFEQLTRNALDYVLRDLRHPDGGFYSAEDADSEGKEGTFYLWTLNEIKTIAGSAADLLIYRYGVTIDGNFFDPHTGESGKNILVQTHSVPEVAKQCGKSLEETSVLLKTAEALLLQIRNKRPRPHLDDKVITEWNGLMISALAASHRALRDVSYKEAAIKAARFLKEKLYDEPARRLYRRWRDGERKIEAQQVDYAMLVQGLTDLFEVTGEPEWLQWALDLHEIQDRLFFDPDHGGYYMNVAREDLLFQMKDDGDNVIPSGNSIAVINAFRLGGLADRNDFVERARKTLHAFSKVLTERPVSLVAMVPALELDEQGRQHVVVVGPSYRNDTQAMLETVFKHASPTTLVVPVDPEKSQKKLANIVPFIGAMKMVDGRATAYVCIDYACQRPTTNPDELREQLAPRRTPWAKPT